ncbi:MFS transporter [Actinobacillus delphinicola]|uniref:Nitrite facilitator 1 n=1 Tax=Actinobacillus delphinicola TaxID=51161 RepID=A0A448TV27_9PAST|nr:MFS transporter [Actinobacillus delphinicola]VEJ09784.1 Nitrite facilitator 1 [Actinobacillus delphinicola]
MKDITKWNVEDTEFWQKEGAKIANRNLWISIPALLSGFAVWLYWSMITVQMLNLGFPISKGELFSLGAIAGLSGATLRIPNSFFIRFCGGRNTIFFTTALLLIPAVGTGIALQDVHTPLWVFQLLALFSGFGGGNFASSMSNISFFFPQKKQGLALGLNAGLGNFGVTTMQIVIPLVMTYGIFGGVPMKLINSSGTLIGKIPAGSESYIQNAAWIWVVFLVPICIAAWFGMNNIKTEQVSPKIGSPIKAMLQMAVMLLIGLIITVIALWLTLPKAANGSGFGVPKLLVLVLTIAATVYALKLLPGEIGKSLTHQYRIFKNKHTWVMSIIYTMTFGSFIGFSAAFPLAIKVIFGYQHVVNAQGVISSDLVNPNGPSALTYAWIAPFIGALIRPVGGWLGDKFGGAIVTQICAILMTIAAAGVAYYMQLAYHSTTPEQYFMPFFLIFLLLFAASGIGNGSTFRTTAIIFPKEEAGPVLGWISAVAAYGAYYIPETLGDSIRATTPQYAMIGLAIFYAACCVLNYVFYLRKNGQFYNP